MSRVVVAFYVSLGLFLLGFGFAGPTSGSPAAVTVGTVGLLGFLGCVAARIGGQGAHASRGAASMRR